MSETNIQLDDECKRWQQKLFNGSLRRKVKLKRIQSLLGNTAQLNCLEISAGDGIISQTLRQHGGRWRSLAINQSAATSLAQFHASSIPAYEGEKLPFPDGHFDLLVIVDSLKNITDDYAFIQECHRIINSSGWVLISERRRSPVSFVTLMQHLLKVAPDNYGCSRNGYTKDQIYRILKDGFDVPETVYYSNALLEIVAAIGDAIQRQINHGPVWLIPKQFSQENLYFYRNLHLFSRLIYPIYWLSSLINIFPKHEMLLRSRRRKWRPRRQPKLIDGRSIAEATINTRIGSAAPF